MGDLTGPFRADLFTLDSGLAQGAIFLLHFHPGGRKNIN
jgi:hypothetical protein